MRKTSAGARACLPAAAAARGGRARPQAGPQARLKPQPSRAGSQAAEGAAGSSKAADEALLSVAQGWAAPGSCCGGRSSIQTSHLAARGPAGRAGWLRAAASEPKLQQEWTGNRGAGASAVRRPAACRPPRPVAAAGFRSRQRGPSSATTAPRCKHSYFGMSQTTHFCSRGTRLGLFQG